MAKRRISKAGVKARYFDVIYNFAEREEHFAAMKDLIWNGSFTASFGSAPHDDDEELAFLSFAIAEEVADAYVRRISAARRRAAKTDQGPSE